MPMIKKIIAMIKDHSLNSPPDKIGQIATIKKTIKNRIPKPLLVFLFFHNLN